MTKFVLVGGYSNKSPDNGEAFVKELVEGFDQPVRILVCLFARRIDEWEAAFQKDKLLFASKLKQKVLLELADPARFKEQLKNTDVVYFRGGRTKALIEGLKQSEGWEQELSDKTIAGSSAGVNFLARYYYSLDDLEIREGLGILPMKALVHYKSDFNAPNIDWDKVYQELREYGEELPILAIPEGEFKVIPQLA
jgi:peptidase E